MTAPLAFVHLAEPAIAKAPDPTDETVGDAIETTFPDLHDRFAMVWDGVSIPLGYTYDLSEIAQPVIWMLEALAEAPDEPTAIHFGDSGFFVEWQITPRGDTLEIEADWRGLSADVQAELATHPSITIETATFVLEWCRLLAFAHRHLAEVGYTVAMLPALAQLDAVLAG